MKGKKRKKSAVWKTVTGLGIALILILLAGLAYVWRASYFKTHFYKGTWINGINCSYLTVNEVKHKIHEKINEYDLTITTLEGDTYTITGPQFHLAYVDNREVDQVIKKQEPLLWIKHAFGGNKFEVSANTTYQETSVEPILRSLPFFQAKNITQPQDAYIQDTADGYSVAPEVEGNALDEEKVIGLVQDAVINGKEAISLVDEACYRKPDLYQNDEGLNQRAQMLNTVTSANLTYHIADETYTINRDLLKTWLMESEDGTCSIDPAQIENYVNTMADRRDTYGGERKFTTHSGETITLKTNKYGWLVNREASVEALKTAIAEGQQGEMDLTYTKKANGTGADDLGDTYVEISIDAQTMWCYKDGKVVVETPVVSGNTSIKGRATPRNGCWFIFWKTTNYTMKGPVDENGNPEYTAYVNYWMPFNGGVGIHDLASRSSFGGNIYKTNGSHGCINTPLAAVKQIYDTVSVGTPVIVY